MKYRTPILVRGKTAPETNWRNMWASRLLRFSKSLVIKVERPPGSRLPKKPIDRFFMRAAGGHQFYN
jgi:hypothetical protein